MLCSVTVWLRAGVAGALLAAFLFLTACQDEQGPAEKAGKEIDEAVEKAGDKVEEAGDEVEEATH